MQQALFALIWPKLLWRTPMKKTQFASVFLALALSMPVAAAAQQRLSEDQLLERATANNVCGERVAVAARYVNETENRVAVTCSDDAEGFVPLAAAGLGLGGAGAAAAAAVGVAALAAGGGGSTPDTQ
jgi:peptidoglycan/LPS O-acetylase OafA/YrhL